MIRLSMRELRSAQVCHPYILHKLTLSSILSVSFISDREYIFDFDSLLLFSILIP